LSNNAERRGEDSSGAISLGKKNPVIATILSRISLSFPNQKQDNGGSRDKHEQIKKELKNFLADTSMVLVLQPLVIRLQ
jgi:hypothetical protein